LLIFSHTLIWRADYARKQEIAISYEFSIRFFDFSRHCRQAAASLYGFRLSPLSPMPLLMPYTAIFCHSDFRHAFRRFRCHISY
jgi:hypothetical protein